MKNIMKVVVVVFALIVFVVFFVSELSLSSVSIKNLDCKCSENIKCPRGFSCEILEGDICGHCNRVGGGTGSSSGGAPSQ